MRWLLAAVTFTAVSFGTAAASAQGVCIDEKAKQSFTCAGAGPKEFDGARNRTGVDLHAVQIPARTAAPTKPPAPATQEPRDERKIRLDAV